MSTCPHVPVTPHPSTMSFALLASSNSAAWVVVAAWLSVVVAPGPEVSDAEVAAAEAGRRRREEGTARRTGFVVTREPRVVESPVAERARHRGLTVRDIVFCSMFRVASVGCGV